MTKTKEAEVPDAKMAMWDRLMPTDPKYTKAFDRGGFKGTATNATYIVRKLTEEFGPCGTGWRFVLDDEQIVEGHTLNPDNGDKAKLHIVRGHLEYRRYTPDAIAVDDPWFATSPQFGQTMLVGRNKNGLFMDEEAPKKSITDCISKCAVLLGIAADVHLGLFDDNKYVNQRKQEEAAESVADAPTPPPAAPAAKAEGDPPAEKPSGNDLDIARQVFHLVKSTAEKATDEKDIDDCLVNNGASLKILAKYPANYDAIKAIVMEARERIKKAAKPSSDPAMNDDIPNFEDMGRP